MKVLVTVEQHFSRSADGKVWTNGQFPYAFWSRYLQVFDEVEVFARCKDVEVVPPRSVRADGDRVIFLDVPDYRGPEECLVKAQAIRCAARSAVQQAEVVILRVPGQMGATIWKQIRKRAQPFAVEVVADPYDVFAPRAIRHPLRAFFRWFSPRRLRQICSEAVAAAYVTESALQKRYPPHPNAYSIGCSDVELPDNAIVDAPRIYVESDIRNLIYVGSLEQLYKAPDVLIRALGVCKGWGVKVRLSLVGSGKCEAELRTLAQQLGVAEQVEFTGQLTTPAEVRSRLDAADIFVLPSRQEGLPRAVVEAMGRALPCIGSTVGGFPELLANEDLVEPDNVAALAQRVADVVSNPGRLNEMSRRNLERAKGYRSAALDCRREAFYREVLQRTVVFRACQ